VRLCEKRERVVFAASSARLPRITSGDFTPKPKGLEDFRQKAFRDRQNAVAELVDAFQKYRKIAAHKPSGSSRSSQ
jgi:hypothetical protein